MPEKVVPTIDSNAKYNGDIPHVEKYGSTVFEYHTKIDRDNYFHSFRVLAFAPDDNAGSEVERVVNPENAIEVTGNSGEKQ